MKVRPSVKKICDKCKVIKRKGKKDLLLPALKSIVKKVDVENKRIDVEIPRGLEDEV